MEKEEFALYFEKPKVERLCVDYIDEESAIKTNLSDEEYEVAIIGVPTCYGSEAWNEGAELAPDAIRKYLYSLPFDFAKMKIADLGNLEARDNESISCALQEVVKELLSMGKKCVIIGGSKQIALPIVKGVAEVKNDVNVVLTDSSLDFATQDEDGLFIPSYLDEISAMESVKNIDILAYQNYLTSRAKLRKIDHRRIEAVRLSAVEDSVLKYEPVLRDSDFYCINCRAMKFADFPALGVPNPNGLSGKDACYLGKLVGMSDRNSVFCIAEYNPKHDINEVSAHLSAQIIWHYLQGVSNRAGDYPKRKLKDYQKYIVYDPPTKSEVVFYENFMNNRWWIKIPMKAGNCVYSCTKEDYQTFLDREIPSIWYRHFMK